MRKHALYNAMLTIKHARKLLKQEHEKYTDKQLEEFIEWFEVQVKLKLN